MKDVLIIDSNTDCQELIKNKLTFLNIRLYFIQDSYNLLNILQENRFDLIIVSHVLKGEYAPDLVLKIRKFNYLGKVLVLSNNSNVNILYPPYEQICPKCIDKYTLSNIIAELLDIDKEVVNNV